ncbi:MAG: RNA polymerase sigma factor [Candidatus Izemoplasmatales bacterium]|nr:RNA polymerase sigma factor [Candidatus Izemoplasmatales bacterium]MDD3865402.1 RNA polymerase sigma factor [Candidatus Izemoplasmatales bacterium]
MAHHFDDYLDLLMEKDENAFLYVYDHTKRGVYSIIIAIVKDRGITEDLMQDTYTKMIANLHSYQRGRNFAAWLFEIAKNIAYDHLRKTKPIIYADPQEQAYLFNQPNREGPKTDYTMAELLTPLNEIERQIVLLRIVSQTKFKDIATTVNKPLGTVLGMYNKALQKMKKSLGKE